MEVKEQLEYIRDVRKIDGMKFKNAKEIGQLIDLHNSTMEKKGGLDYEKLVHEMAVYHVDRAEKNPIIIK